MADIHDDGNKDKGQVRVMTYQDEADYNDITIEEVWDEESSEQKQGKRPESFDRVYEDNSSRQRNQNRQNSFKSYGSRRPHVFSVNLGNGMSIGRSWKYKIIGALAAAALVAFLLFVALPFLSVVVMIGVIAYLLYNFFA